MDTSKIIIGTVGGGRYTVTAPIVKEDYGLYLKIEGLELPPTYEVDFSNDEHNGTSVTMIGNADGVLIPSQFISSGKDVFAFLYHVGADFGRTVYKFRIPNKCRPDRTNQTPTPEEQSTIDQAINALNTAVAKTAQDVIDADASAQSASQSAENAHDSAVDAQNYAESASGYASDAQGYATTASQKATAAGNSADRAAQIKTDIEGYVSTAQGYAQTATDKAAQASQSATNASNSATTASTKAGEASASATTASNKAGEASASATTASNKATEASGYANTASQKASDASDSASAAFGYKTDAESAKTAAQTAQGKAEDAQEAAETAAASVSASAAQIATNTADIADLQTDVAQNEADILKAFPTDSASGSIASFPDGADAIPLKSLVVDIGPVQDLHGYDSPWVGGGGKNLLKNTLTSRTVNGLTITVDDFGRITVNGTATANTSLSINSDIGVSAGTYVISGITGGSTSTYKLEAKADGAWGKNVTTKPLTVTVTEGLTNLALVIYSDVTLSNVVISPMICDVSASNPTVFAPYENICPISGWTEVNVEQRGVNVWDEELEVGSFDSNGNPIASSTYMRSKNYIPLIPNATYYFTRPSIIAWVYYYTDTDYIKYVQLGSGVKTFAPPSNATRAKFLVATSAYGTTYNHDISINYPSTDHSYHPYTGRSITIQLGQTVYGGKLDVLTGKLVIDRASIVYDGSSDEEWIGSDSLPWRYGIAIRDIKLGNAKSLYVTSNLLPTTTAHWGTSNYGILNNYTQLVVGYPPAQNDVAEFKAFLASNPLQVVYLLETPITYTLTATQVTTLLGTNNIWADSGDTEVVYRADTKLFIERLTAPDSADMIADSNITSGQYFMVGNSLFKATANIANGSAIVVGTNCIRKSLSEALNEINA